MRLEYDEEFLNSNGQLDGVHTRTRPYKDVIEYEHVYKDGTLLEARDFTISIDAIKPLVGTYQDGNPYLGYFVYQNEMEIPVIDFFEAGVLQAQYTTTLRELIESEYREEDETGNKFALTKTVFKNGKPWEGLIHRGFKLREAHLLATEYVKEGLIEKADLWLMAMHYAELIQLEFLPHGYRIYKEAMPNIEDDAIDGRARSIEIQFSDSTSGSLQFQVESDNIVQYQFRISDVSEPLKKEAGSVYYFPHEESVQYIQRSGFDTNKVLYQQAFSHNAHIISSVYMYIAQRSIPRVEPSAENDYAKLFNLESRPNQKGTLFLNGKGEPLRGDLVEKIGKLFRLTHFEESLGKVVGNDMSLKELCALLNLKA